MTSRGFIAVCAAALLVPATRADPPEIDPESGLLRAEGHEFVKAYCTGCHSARLIAQNRASAREWSALLKRMQREHGAPSPGEHEEALLTYLARYYAPLPGRGRRAPAVRD